VSLHIPLVFHLFHGRSKASKWPGRQAGLGHPYRGSSCGGRPPGDGMERYKGSAVRKKVAEIGTWFIGVFCSGMRGEEMILVELAGTANSLRFFTDPANLAHFCFVVAGRTKGNWLSGS